MVLIIYGNAINTHVSNGFECITKSGLWVSKPYVVCVFAVENSKFTKCNKTASALYNSYYTLVQLNSVE